jgi:hypothetical protein
MQTGKNLTHEEAKMYSSWIMGYIMKPITPKSSVGHIKRSLQLHKSLMKARDDAIASGLAADEVTECVEAYRDLMVANDLSSLLESKYGMVEDIHEAEEFTQYMKGLQERYETLNAKLHLDLESTCQNIDPV